MSDKCFRCGRYGHWASDCFANTTFSGKRIFEDHETFPKKSIADPCFRCGRYGHWASDCFANTTFSGKCIFEDHEINENRINKLQKGIRSGVYCIQDMAGNIYVGKSDDIDQRIMQHTSEKGPVYELKPITESLPNDFESWERNETLARMRKHGIEKVRGWMYTSKFPLTKETVNSIQKQINEKYDLCRKCGKQGHFANECFVIP